LKQLFESGLWGEILAIHGWRGCERHLSRAEEAERLCAEVRSFFPESGGRLDEYLNHEIEAGISVRLLIKLAAVLYSCDKSELPYLAERLKLGKEARRLLNLFCRDEEEVYGILELSAAERVMYRFFQDREPAGLGMLIIASSAGIVSDASFFRLVEYWLQKYKVGDSPLFLTGGEIMAALCVPPGQSVGAAAARLREAEWSGLVTNREEAMEFIKKLLTREQPMR
jgi:hypothetical protein